LVEAIKVVAGKATEVKFALEPINRYETDLINTVVAGLSLVDKVGLDNFGLLLDTFHMNIEEKDIAASIKDAGDRMFHLHIADSNRWYPGGGHTDFAAIVEALDRIDYKAFISAEIMPLPDSDTAAAKTIEFMRSITA
ncbi:MAG: TIM barrel protein, partial [Candidatus Marinimicrobia bacterium]|nr:TIM barrel protein [Candidatus Neomarinimicrobiota bacterium]